MNAHNHHYFPCLQWISRPYFIINQFSSNPQPQRGWPSWVFVVRLGRACWCFPPLSGSLRPTAPGPVEGSPWSLELDGAVNIWWAAVCFQQLNRRPRSEKSADSPANTNASSTNRAERAQPRCQCAQTLTRAPSISNMAACKQTETYSRSFRMFHNLLFYGLSWHLFWISFWIHLLLRFYS